MFNKSCNYLLAIACLLSVLLLASCSFAACVDNVSLDVDNSYLISDDVNSLNCGLSANKCLKDCGCADKCLKNNCSKYSSNNTCLNKNSLDVNSQSDSFNSKSSFIQNYSMDSIEDSSAMVNIDVKDVVDVTALGETKLIGNKSVVIVNDAFDEEIKNLPFTYDLREKDGLLVLKTKEVLDLVGLLQLWLLLNLIC